MTGKRIFRRLAGVAIAGGITVAGFQVFVGGILTEDDWDDTIHYLKKDWFITTSQAPKPKIIVLGTGWAAISFIQNLDQEKVDLKVISPRPYFFYTPLLAGTATGTTSTASIMEPIRWYCSKFGHHSTKYIQAECKSVDIGRKQVLCETEDGRGMPLDYDVLVLAVGAEPATFGIKGVKEHAMFMKEVQDAIIFQRKFLENLEKASYLLYTNHPIEEVRKLLHIVIVGGGPTGVELTAEVTDFIKQDAQKYFPELVDHIKLTLIEATDRILGVFDKSTAQYAEGILLQRGASLVYNAVVSTVTADHIEYKHMAGVPTGTPTAAVPANRVPYGMLMWTAGIATRPVVRDVCTAIGPDVQNSRFGLLVDKHFRALGVADGSVFAIGDCSVSGCGPTAQAAMQQGKYLGRMFRRILEKDGAQLGRIPNDAVGAYPPFIYSNKGALAYVGGSKGIAELKSLLWDKYPTPESKLSVEGVSAFAIWRSLYFSRLMSGRNQAQVGFDWLKASIFGRDISSPFFTYDSGQKQVDKNQPKIEQQKR